MTWIAALLAACFSIPAAPASAQDAMIVASQGRVQLRPWGESRYLAAKAGDKLIYGDGVRTGPGSIAQLQLADGAVVLVQERSELTLGGTVEETVVSFSIGEFLIGLKRKLERGRRFRARTPAAVAAVRGTLFWGRTDERKTAVFAGFGEELTVTAKGRTIRLKAGETVTVPFGKPPPEPKPHSVPRGYLKTFAVDGSLQGLDDLVDLRIR